MSDSDARTGTEILPLMQDFPPVPTAVWEAAIQKDLKAADYEKKLVWRSDEGIAVRPYYRSENLAGVGAQTASIPGQFPLWGGDAGGVGDRAKSRAASRCDSRRPGPRSRCRRHPAGRNCSRVGRGEADATLERPSGGRGRARG